MAGTSLELPVGFTFGGDTEAAHHYEIRDAAERSPAVGAPTAPTAPSGIAAPLGQGGAGGVYVARHRRNQILRAVKILLHDEPLFQKTFLNEIQSLSRLRHPNLSSIIEWGTMSVPDPRGSGHRSALYYVMDLVNGSELHDHIVQRQPNALALGSLLHQLFEVLHYLHSQDPPTLHCDVKENNVLVEQTSAGPILRLVDLGVAHRVRNPQSPSDTTFFAGTRRRLPASIVEEFLPGRAMGGHVPVGRLSDWCPALDLHLVGTMLDGLFFSEADRSIPQDRRRDLKSAIGEPAWRFFERFAGRLKFKAPTDTWSGPIVSARDAQSELQKLNPAFAKDLGVAELGAKSRGVKSITMPRSDRVVSSGRLLRLINHPLLQRLRDYLQLNFVHLIYPGATHTRFVHSLRAYDLARDVIASLLADEQFRENVTAAELEAVLLWALLHDVGHYPLSHMFEIFAQKSSAQSDGMALGDRRLFAYMLRLGDDVPEWAGNPTWDALMRAFRKYHPRVPSLLATIRESFDPDVARALQELAAPESLAPDAHGDTRPSLTILRGIVDGAMDVDKLSYLELDSHFSGAPFGHGLDRDAFLSSLCIAENPELGPVLAIEPKALPAVEEMLKAREWMFSRVYWNKYNRAIMAMFRRAIGTLLKQEHDRLDFNTFLEEHLFGSDLSAAADLAARYSAVAKSDLLFRVLHGRREVHRRLLAASQTDLHARALFRPIDKLGWTVVSRSLDGWEKIHLAEDRVRDVIAHQFGVEVAVDDLLIDFPGEFRQPQTNLWVRDGSRVRPIKDMSEVPDGLERTYDQRLRRLRIFVNRALEARLKERRSGRAVDSDVHDALRHACVAGLAKHADPETRW